MDPVLVAFWFGALSAASLPLGAAAGIWLKPGERTTAAVMAFGAGALLCALTLELVAPALALFPDDEAEGFKWLAIGAVIGCVLFVGLDHLLAQMGGYLRKHATVSSRLKHLRKHQEHPRHEKLPEHVLFADPGHTATVRAMHLARKEKSGSSNVALAIWLGIALDGIPESLIIGSTMEGSSVSLALIGGLFLANIPESMSSAAVMKKQGSPSWLILVMWFSLMVMTAVGAAFGNVFIAGAPHHLSAMLEGLAAGAMLAMIAQTMLPEAYEHGGWLTGLMTVAGFLAAIWMGTLGA
jgi:zinc transporter ZupT